MQKKINERNQAEIVFSGRLVSLSDSTLTNTNGKNYKVGSIEFVNAQGELVTRNCQVYEGNYSKGMELNKDYRATARKGDDGGVYIQLSHLPMSSNASEEDFPDELFDVTVVNVTNTSTVSVGSEVL